MAAVYEGVTNSAGYEGTLFGGLKFWVALRVPCREWYINELKNNGAKIVQLEKFADVLIADRLRVREAPLDSVTYEYIDTCIKKHELCNAEDFKIHQVKPGHSAALGHALKQRRTPFTPQDDKILINWVLQHERAGYLIQGNKIYDTLAAEHPHHTSQSWRDRWVKKYKNVSRKDLPYQEVLDSSSTPLPRPSAPQPARRAPRMIPSPTPVSKAEGHSGTPRRRVRFTEEDDKLLRQYVSQRLGDGEREQGKKIFMELEEEFPHHTWQSWRDRWLKYVREREASPASNTSSLPPIKRIAKSSSGRPKNHSRSKDRTAEAATPQVAHGKTEDPGKASYNIPKIPRHASGILKDQHAEPQQRRPEGPESTKKNSVSKAPPLTDRAMRFRRIKAARSIQRVWRGYKVRRDLGLVEGPGELFRTAAEGSLADQDLPSYQGTQIKSEPDEEVQIPDNKNASKTLTEEERIFYEDLSKFQELHALDPVKTAEIRIGSKNMILPFWELWSKTTAQDCPPESRNREDIARAMEIDWVKFPEVTDQLKALYDKHLLEFEYAKKAFEAFEDSEDEYETADESEASGPSGFAPSAAPDLHSSPPPIGGLKRSLSRVIESSDTSFLDPSAKRRRYDRDDEIPCSPDLVRHTGNPGVEPEPSPLRLPLLSRPQEKERVVEPETQDFMFDGPSGGHLIDDPSDSTPSRQLRSEMGQLPGTRSPASDSSEDAFDPPVNESRPKPSVAARSSAGGHEVRRRTLPPSWTRAANKRPARDNGQSVGTVRQSPEYMPRTPTMESPSTSRRGSTQAIENAVLSGYRNPSHAVLTFKDRPSVTQTTPKNFKIPKGGGKVIDHFMSLGYSRAVALDALAATTFVPSEAGVVMESLEAGKGIPQDTAGVWTQQDDAGLRMMNRFQKAEMVRDWFNSMRVFEERRRLKKKHGDERMLARARYLGCSPIF